MPDFSGGWRPPFDDSEIGDLVIVAPSPTDAPLGMYIHIPFCSHICPYCDFTTYAGKESLIPRYVENLIRSLDATAPTIGERAVATVFFGGGTPSLLGSHQVQTVLDACRQYYRLTADAEISMECNPNGLTLERLAGYRAAGVNRLSIGAQTFDRGGLRRLGRQHEASDTRQAVTNARAAGFENVSLDFIFGWPGQTLSQWRADLEQILAMPDGPDHVSLYSLIVEPGTPYADAAARGILRMPDDDATADMYELAIEVLGEADWSHYEVANWTRHPENYSRHNALYWQHGDYLGIGAGAFGTLGEQRTMNHLLPRDWCDAIERGESGASNTECIDPQTAMAETMLLGLRLLESGVDAAAFATRHGISLVAAFGETIRELCDIGMLEETGHGVRLTDHGLLLANDVIARFL